MMSKKPSVKRFDQKKTFPARSVKRTVIASRGNVRGRSQRDQRPLKQGRGKSF